MAQEGSVGIHKRAKPLPISQLLPNS